MEAQSSKQKHSVLKNQLSTQEGYNRDQKASVSISKKQLQPKISVRLCYVQLILTYF